MYIIALVYKRWDFLSLIQDHSEILFPYQQREEIIQSKVYLLKLQIHVLQKSLL